MPHFDFGRCRHDREHSSVRRRRGQPAWQLCLHGRVVLPPGFGLVRIQSRFHAERPDPNWYPTTCIPSPSPSHQDISRRWYRQVNARAVSVDEPPNASSSSTEFSFQFTYTIGPDRVLSTILVPGTYHATILPGPRAGQTLVNQVPARSGFIGEDARTIVLGQPGPVIESVAFSNGDQVLRLCNRSRILTRIKDDDR
jgi:hypothetical protein